MVVYLDKCKEDALSSSTSMSDLSIAWHFDGETPDRKKWLMCTWINNWSEISIIWHTTQLSKCCSAATGADLNSQF